eukprot:Skav213686  [mRNA]  locus=scaffold491:397144:402459:- [translate_table: standard]
MDVPPADRRRPFFMKREQEDVSVVMPANHRRVHGMSALMRLDFALTWSMPELDDSPRRVGLGFCRSRGPSEPLCGGHLGPPENVEKMEVEAGPPDDSQATLLFVRLQSSYPFHLCFIAVV